MAASRTLSTLDAAFFLFESGTRMANVGPLAIVKPPPRTRDPGRFADKLLEMMMDRPVGPPFNVVYRPPGLGSLPRLETVDDVDVADHCHRHRLTRSKSERTLFDYICRLHEQRLDRTRPPWELHVIDGIPGGRIALYAKVHHGIIDGRGLVEMFARWFSVDRADRNVRAPWETLPTRQNKASTDSVIESAVKTVTQGVTSLASLSAALGRQALASTGIMGGMRLPFLDTTSDLGGKPSVRRNFACCILPLQRVKALAKAHDATVNDVLLTVLDMGLNAYLTEHGKRRRRPLVADMPVALKTSGTGNTIAALQFPLGKAAASALERLKQICEHTAEVKTYVSRTDAAALMTYTAAVHSVPALTEALGLPLAPTLANVTISNPHFGLVGRRYIAGAELELVLPISVLAPGQALNITAVTYDRNLQIGFMGLEEAIPGVQHLAELTVDAFEELVAA